MEEPQTSADLLHYRRLALCSIVQRPQTLEDLSLFERLAFPQTLEGTNGWHFEIRTCRPALK